MDPTHCLGPVATGLKQSAQFRQHLRLPHRLDIGDGLAVNARGSFVATHLLPGVPQQVWPSHPVIQGVEPPLPVSLRGHIERSLECVDFVDGVVGLRHALTHPSQLARHRSAGPSLRRVLLSRRSSVLCPAPTPSAPPWTSVWPYTGACFRGYRFRRGCGRVSPVDRPAFAACRLLYAGAVPGCSRIHGPEYCLRPILPGSACSFPYGSDVSARRRTARGAESRTTKCHS